jgi:prolyl-tRNA synthetase
MMGDGKALQMGTSHELGQNFARAFEIDYFDSSGEQQLCWTTSWGSTTRMIGGLIMCHGDDRGMRVPPALAHIQAIVVVVRDGEGVGEAAARLVDDLAAAGVRARLDAQTATGFGRRITDWELKGVPVRVEVGPRDLEQGVVAVVRRDLAADDPSAKATVPLAGAVAAVSEALAAAQTSLLAEATASRDARTAVVATVEEAVEAAATGFARLPWSVVGEDGEARLGEQGATVRCLQRPDGSVPDELTPDVEAIVARAY